MKSFDATARVPYLTRAASPGFTTYDDEVSIAAKCSLAKSLKLGGAIVWHLAGDVMPDGSSSTPPNAVADLREVTGRRGDGETFSELLMHA